jgi:hypothetical protein
MVSWVLILVSVFVLGYSFMEASEDPIHGPTLHAFEDTISTADRRHRGIARQSRGEPSNESAKETNVYSGTTSTKLPERISGIPEKSTSRPSLTARWTS